MTSSTANWACRLRARTRSSDTPSQAQPTPDISSGGVGFNLRDRETADAPLRIVNIRSGSAAEKAGMKAPAYLLTVDGTNLTQTPLAEAIQLIRGPVGKAVTIQTTDFDRQQANTYSMIRSRFTFAMHTERSRATLSEVTTNDILVAKTRAGETATIQFLSFPPPVDDEGGFSASATYRIRFNGENTVKTNLLKESYSSRRTGKETPDLWLTARTDHATQIKIGSAKVEWSYGSNRRAYGHVSFDTNQISVTREMSARFPEDSN